MKIGAAVKPAGFVLHERPENSSDSQVISGLRKSQQEHTCVLDGQGKAAYWYCIGQKKLAPQFKDFKLLGPTEEKNISLVELYVARPKLG